MKAILDFQYDCECQPCSLANKCSSGQLYENFLNNGRNNLKLR